MNGAPLRTRIAPTPSGFLHLGNLFSFALTWLIARINGGTLRLRIDDLDAARMRTAYLEDIFSTLDYLGLLPDEGPSGVEDFFHNHSQQLRIESYSTFIKRLKDAGHLYGCSCSRSKIMAESPAGIYTGTCRKRGLDMDEAGMALRLCLPDEGPVSFTDIITGGENRILLAAEMGDFVVQRKDGLPAYQVASLCDDLHYGINLVVRGSDLLSSTAAQLTLAQVAGFDDFLKMRWHHHMLLKNEHQQKLSKSAGDLSVGTLIENGMEKKYFFTLIGSWLGLQEQTLTSAEELQKACSEKGLFRLIR